LAKASTEYDGCDSRVYYIVNPQAGTNNISITWGPACDANMLIGAVSFYNADTRDPIYATGEQTGNRSNFTVTINALNGGIVVFAFMHTGTSSNGSPGTGSTEIGQRNSNDSNGSAYEANCTASTQVVGWAGFSPSDSAMSGSAVSFRPATHRGGASLFF